MLTSCNINVAMGQENIPLRHHITLNKDFEAYDSQVML